MKRDFEKLADRMIENARDGIAAEQKILEWKFVEQQAKVSADPISVRKAG